MEINKDTLAEAYANKNDDELLDLHATGTLTNIAYEAIEAEMLSRNISIPERQSFTETDNLKKKRTGKILTLVLIFFAWLIYSMILQSGREERLNKAVDKVISGFQAKEALNNTEPMPTPRQ